VEEEAILREPDAAGAQGRLDSLVLNLSKPFCESSDSSVSPRESLPDLWQKPVEKVLHAACAAVSP